MANINIDGNWREDTFEKAHEYAAYRKDVAFNAAHIYSEGRLEVLWWDYDDKGRLYTVATWHTVSKRWSRKAASNNQGVYSILDRNLKGIVEVPYNLILGRDGDEVLSLILGG